MPAAILREKNGRRSAEIDLRIVQTLVALAPDLRASAL
jgi:hypothetical protein